MDFQPHLRWTACFGLHLREMVVAKFSAIVGLDTGKRKGWLKEPRGVLQEVNRGLGVPARIDALVLNPGSAVNEVVLVTLAFPVLDVHLAYFTWVILSVTKPSTGADFLLAFLEYASSFQDVTHPVARYINLVIPSEDVCQGILAVTQAKPKLQDQANG